MIVLRTVFLLLVLTLPLLLGDLGLIAAAGIVFVHIIFDRDSRRATLSARWIGFLPSILLGAVFAVALVTAMGLVVEPLILDLTGERVDLSAFAGVEGNFTAYIQLLLIGLIVGGIFEEVVFRGYIIGWGSRILTFMPALLLAVISATIFGLAHAYQGIAGMISTGFIGLCLGLLYIAVGRKILAPIAAHMTVNIIGITAIYLGYGL